MCGAVDYITKPISPPIVLARVAPISPCEGRRRELALRNQTLEETVAANARANSRMTQDVTIQALASLVESRDHETGGHILRTQRYVKHAWRSKCGPIRASTPASTTTPIDLMCKSAPLHDIGKVGSRTRSCEARAS